MTLSDSDRGKLDKAIDDAIWLAPTMIQLANNGFGKEILMVSKSRDFVLGSLITYAVREFIGDGIRREFALDDQIEMYLVILKRLYSEIGMLRPDAPKHAKPSKHKKR